MSIDTASLGILWPAFIAGILVTATHVPLGMKVLERGIVFIDLAIAQIAGVGVILADYLGWEPTGVAVQIAALSAGPVVVVQPLLVLAVPVALPVGALLGGRRPRLGDYLACAAIIAGLVRAHLAISR